MVRLTCACILLYALTGVRAYYFLVPKGSLGALSTEVGGSLQCLFLSMTIIFSVCLNDFFPPSMFIDVLLRPAAMSFLRQTMLDLRALSTGTFPSSGFSNCSIRMTDHLSSRSVPHFSLHHNPLEDFFPFFVPSWRLGWTPNWPLVYQSQLTSDSNLIAITSVWYVCCEWSINSSLDEHHN